MRAWIDSVRADADETMPIGLILLLASGACVAAYGLFQFLRGLLVRRDDARP